MIVTNTFVLSRLTWHCISKCSEMYFENIKGNFNSPKVFEASSVIRPATNNSRNGSHNVHRTSSSLSDDSDSSSLVFAPHHNTLQQQSLQAQMYVCEDLASLRDENDRLRHHFTEQHKRYLELEDQLTQSRADREHMIVVGAQQAQELNHFRKLASNSIDIAHYDRLKDELEQRKIANSVSSQQLREVKRELQNMEKTITKLQDENIEIQQRNDLLTAELQAVRAQAQHEKAGFKKFVIDFDDLQASLEQYKEKYTLASEENQELRKVVQKCLVEQNLMFQRRISRKIVSSDASLAYEPMNTIGGSNLSLNSLSNLTTSANSLQTLTACEAISPLSENASTDDPIDHSVCRQSSQLEMDNLSLSSPIPNNTSNLNSSVVEFNESNQSSTNKLESTTLCAESVSIVLTKELELQLEDSRQEVIHLRAQLDELRSEKDCAQQQTILYRERINKLVQILHQQQHQQQQQSALRFSLEQQSNKNTIKLPPKVTMESVLDLTAADEVDSDDENLDDFCRNDTFNNNNRFSNDGYFSNKVLSTINDDRTSDEPDSQNISDKKKKRRWLRLLCFTTSSTHS